MEILYANFSDQKIQDYLYDCLRAAHDAIVVVKTKYLPTRFPWRTGTNEINIVGVRGFRDGKVIPNFQSEWDDTLFVTRINSAGAKEVWKFEASLDYSSGQAPILMEGCYLYHKGIHMKKYYEQTKALSKKRYAKPPQTITEEELKQEISNNTNNRFALSDKFKSKKFYRALTTIESYYDRDYNQNNSPDAFEPLLHGSVGINIHFGGEGEDVGTFSGGCQVIHGFRRFQQFMRLVESDESVKFQAEEQFRDWKKNELEPDPGSLGTSSITYTLVEGPFFEHFLQCQSAAPLGEVAEANFGKLHDFSRLDFERIVRDSSNQGTFPVSGNRQWHSGVHLMQTGSQRVVAPMAGTIVAARLGCDPIVTPSGQVSPNFILIQHMFRGFPVYTLIQNLGKLTSSNLSQFPWLNGELSNDERFETPWRSPRRFAAFRATKELNCWNSRVKFTPKSEPLQAADLQPSSVEKLDPSPIPSGTIFWICEQPTSMRKISTKITRDDYECGTAPKLREAVNSGKYRWGISANRPQGCWIDVTNGYEAFDPIAELLAGNVVPFLQPILPGELLSDPAILNESPGIHFEIFSSYNIFTPETSIIPLTRTVPSLDSLLKNQATTPAWSKRFSIAKTAQGLPTALPGDTLNFDVLSVSNADSASISKINWKIRIMNDDGATLHESDHKEVGPNVSFVVPSDPDLVWSQIIAQPYIDEPDPRMLIRKTIIPGKIIAISDPSVQAISPKEGVFDSIIKWMRMAVDFAADCIRKDAQIQQLQQINNAKMVSRIFNRDDTMFEETYQSLVLEISTPWKYNGAADKKRAEESKLRVDWDSTKTLQWWDGAHEAGVSLPPSDSLYYFHPLRFMHSLPMLSDGLDWTNQHKLDTSEVEYSGSGSIIKLFGKGKDFEKSDFKINNVPQKLKQHSISEFPFD